MLAPLDWAHRNRPQAVESGASPGSIGRTERLEATHSTTVRGGALPGRNAERGRMPSSFGSAGSSAAGTASSAAGFGPGLSVASSVAFGESASVRTSGRTSEASVDRSGSSACPFNFFAMVQASMSRYSRSTGAVLATR
jgi:hypothetical protein